MTPTPEDQPDSPDKTRERDNADSTVEAGIEDAQATKDPGVETAEAETPTGTPGELVAEQDSSPASRPQSGGEGRSVARSAGIVSLAVMGSRVLGLVREQVFAAYFGAGFLNDAFQVAFRIPNTLRDLFAEGALSVAFVKTFTDYSVKKSEEEAWRLASMVLNVLAIVLSVITICGIIFSPQIVAIIAGDFSPEKARLATTMTRIMFPFILLVALAAVAMGVLNTKGRFGIPASASTLFNVGSIVGGLGFAYWLSGGSWSSPRDPQAVPESAAQWAIIGMAIGTLIGGGLQFLIQVPSLLRVGFRFRPLVSFTDPGVRQVMRLMGPAVIGTAAVQINVLINTFFAQSIPGGVSWLGYAFRLMQLPIGVFGVAIGTATLPTISKFAARGDIGNFRSTLSSSIGLVFLLTIPSACGLVVLGRPIIALIYERGAFTSTTTEMVATALAAYSVGLAGYAAIRVLSPAFYALDDARTPMLVSLISILVNAVASYFFRDIFSQVGVTPATPSGYGHVGLALSTSCVALINFFALVFIMRRRIQRLEGRRILSSFVRITLASAALSAASYFTYAWLHAALGGRSLTTRLIETFVPIAVGGAVFLISARLLGVEELRQAIQAVTGRFLRRR
ncbi:MAG TPA: murein biosynthesis integral membrane protein MurJ [Pyrinomonadaceae bacterium]|nr:murein biosynthesis integral membrane protein MurJ [Pyrinomonadaceae bacterium]